MDGLLILSNTIVYFGRFPFVLESAFGTYKVLTFNNAAECVTLVDPQESFLVMER